MKKNPRGSLQFAARMNTRQARSLPVINRRLADPWDNLIELAQVLA
jgi:hypothetical protein